jgi:GNAT superfamily N-acetyltransferase
LELRNPNKGHYPDVMALLQRCFEPAWEPQTLIDRVYFEPHYDPNHVWMARESGQVLGFMVTTLHEGQAWLKLLAVDPDARRRGIAKDMLIASTPPFEFLPGVEPGSVADQFFLSQGYQASDFQTQWVAPGLFSTGRDFDKVGAIAFAQVHAGEAWPWVEETLGFKPPRVVFEAGQGLALADPGQSLGPLWLQADAQPSATKALLEQALAIASSSRCRDPRGLRFWQVPGSLALPEGTGYAVHDERLHHFRKTLA